MRCDTAVVVALYVQQNAERLALSPRCAAWYPKPAATLVEALARLRRHLWFGIFCVSADGSDVPKSLTPEVQRLIQLACYAS